MVQMTDWARNWSYDAIGFVRPGRVAFLKHSLALTNYRLEFLAQIEAAEAFDACL